MSNPAPARRDEDAPSRAATETVLERLIDRVTDAVSWVWLGLIAVIILAVSLRFVFGVGRIELEELQWHLYAIGFLFGIVACARRDRHVRVDVLRERMTARTKSWVDLYGILLFQIPLVALVLWSSVPLVSESYLSSEKSASAGGLPYRFVLRAVLPIAFVLLGAATLGQLLAVARALFVKNERPDPASDSP